jgi:two-component system phosphate regulon sensor histidine kinase PhoR
LGFLLGAALLGWTYGHITVTVLAAAFGCLAWHLFHLYRLEHWLQKEAHFQPPNTHPLRPSRIWKEVYEQFFLLRQRNRKRKRKIGRTLKQFQSAAAALPDAIVVLREDDTVQWCNDASQRLLELRHQDIDLQITTLVRHPSFIHFLSQRRYDYSVTFPSPADASTMLSVRLTPYGKKKYLLLATDITHVHHLEQMRQDFIANVSHELRTPLTVITGYLETLLDSEDSCTKLWQRPLRGMQQQSCRMLRIVEDLLMLSRLETQTEQPPQRVINVPSLLEAIAEDAAALSGERAHHIALQVDRELCILGYELELRSAFSNLIFNAVRYTPDKGHIHIRWYKDERGIHMEVEDNGEGIAPQHLQRITERFYRIDRDRSRDSGGTGLGLAIVKHVMKNHGGKLNISSLVGIGSIFACDFPLGLQISETIHCDADDRALMP